MEFQLGLCKLPEPIYLYVRSGDSEGSNYCWHYYDRTQEKTTPEYSTGVCGYLSELRIVSKEFKGKESMKLDIVISANETYIIRTGIETYFAKTFLLAIAGIEDFSQPLVIGCVAGEESVVFCRVYDAQTKARVKAEWNANADWGNIIDRVQSRLGEV